jgi:hypothetical protein
MSTNVPGCTFSANGFVTPTEQAVLVGVCQDLQTAFGGALNLDPANADTLSTPQGQLAQSITAIIGNVYDTFISLANNVDPAFASGRYQDAIGRIYFLERLPALPTLVTATCTGLTGTPIPTGALAQAADGNIYSCTAGGEIPAGGSISLPFACQATGPIACPANSLNAIYRAIPGWDTVNNPLDGVLGQNVESRAAFETRRQQSVAQNSVGSLPSILGAVLGVTGVLDAYVTENTAATPVTIGGVSVAAKSVYVAALGGVDLDVATAIWSKKAPGCAYNGSTTVVVTDPNYSPPLPTYNVSFVRPTSLPILFIVNLTNNTQVPSNVVAQVQAAIVNAFGGGDGGPRARIGSTVYASRFVAPIVALGSWALVSSMFVGSSNSPTAAFTAAIAGTLMTVSAVSSGTLHVGDSVLGNGVADGTIISSLGSGSGGTGTYNLSISQTVSSESMTTAKATLSSVTVNINQAPTISAANIQVNLV